MSYSIAKCSFYIQYNRILFTVQQQQMRNGLTVTFEKRSYELIILWANVDLLPTEQNPKGGIK